MNSKPWFENWFAEDYVLRYGHRDYLEAEQQVLWIKANLLDETQLESSVVADVCCGQGRHLRAFHQLGISKCFGIDLSQYLLSNLISKCPVIRSRMDNIPLQDGSVDIVTSFFTSFGYLSTEEDNLKLLHEFQRVMRGGGYLVLDIANRRYLECNLI